MSMKSFGSPHLYCAHSGTCWLLLIRILEVTVVDAILPNVPMEVSDSFDPARDIRDGVLRDDGDRVTLARGTKIPNLSGHSKYLRNKFYSPKRIRHESNALFCFIGTTK